MSTLVAPRTEHELLDDLADALGVGRPISKEERVINVDYRTNVLRTALEKLKSPQQRVDSAIDLAKLAHKGQLYGSKDYFTHHVMGVANSFENDSDEFVVAILHDVLEDSDIEPAEIRAKFGALISEAVMLLTKTKQETYDEYIRNIVLNQHRPAGKLAHAVKMADVQFNLAASYASGSQKFIGKYHWVIHLLENYWTEI